MQQQKIISPDFLQKLELLQLIFKKRVRGSIKGERSSARRGRSVEFADYRNYVPGDEIRIIDWNIYGRLDKLFVKLFVEEEELTLYILLDHSLSMDFGTPSKLTLARQLAGALSYVAMSNFDRVSLSLVGEDLSRFRSPIRGKGQIFRVFQYLEEAVADGGTSLGASLGNFSSRKAKPGLVVIISDFLDPSDFFGAMKYLMFQKHQLFLIQVLDSLEINPDAGGDLRLIDVETGDAREVTVTDRLLDMYKKRLAAHMDGIRQFCRTTGAGYVLAPTWVPFEDLVMEYLRVGRLVR
jgi:uncharacterized protein (DUF58 family)